jgi:EAL domain-containing protein (putative c-di-GMP-specific phosphodiesterase class I)/GGDEF domain-containing protein
MACQKAPACNSLVVYGQGIALSLLELSDKPDIPEGGIDPVTGLPLLVIPPPRVAAALVIDIEQLVDLYLVRGRAVLDHAMAELTDRVTGVLGPNCRLWRYGEARFAAIFDEVQHPAEPLFTARAVSRAVAEPVGLPGDEFVPMVATIGVASATGRGTDGEAVMRQAKMALGEARSIGLPYLQYSPDLGERLTSQVELRQELREAIRLGRFELHYQPKMSLTDGSCFGVEALLRWRHPTRGLVAPMDFIPIAEETGLIVPLGEWVLREACRQARAWENAGLPPLQIAVNISERQFRSSNLPALIEVVLRENNLSPDRLQLEITEAALLRDLPDALSQMRWIAKRGVAFALDDFGTGYSSLSYLRELPLERLKIDRKFVAEMDGDVRTRHLVGAIVAMARAMDLKVVAEGIETQTQLDMLRGIGCDEGQGFLIEHPMPAAQLESWLRLADFRQVAQAR